MKRMTLAIAAICAAALAACGKAAKSDDNTSVTEGSGAQDGWVELEGEAAEKVSKDLAALDALEAGADNRSGADFAAAIDAYRHGAGARGYFDAADFPYRPSEYGQITDLPPDAAADGITGAAGLVLDAPSGPFKTALVSYLIFDTAANAAAYRKKLDRNFTQSLVETATLDLTNPETGQSEVEVRCVYVPDTDNSVNCHHLGPSARIVAVTLFTGGPYLEFTGAKRAIDLVLENSEAELRILDVLAEEAAYLFDAARP
jgi:hypothetical protein